MMSSGEVIDAAIRVYQQLGWTFLRLTLVPSLFCLASIVFFFDYVLPSYFVTSNASSQSVQMGEMAFTTALALFIAAPLFVIGLAFASAIVTRLVSDFMLGNPPNVDEALAGARRITWRMVWLLLRVILLSSVGTLVALGLLMISGALGSSTSESDATAGIVLVLAILGFVVGGVTFLWVWQRSALAPAAMVLEDRGVKEASQRSTSLLKSHPYHGTGAGTVWLVYLLLFVLYLLMVNGVGGSLAELGFPDNVRGWMAGIPFAGLFTEALRLVPLLIAVWTLVPIWAATMTIIYYDRRIRLEGYDIEALAQDVWRADRARRFDV